MDLAPLQAALDALDAEVTQAEAERAEAQALLQRCEERVTVLQAERSGIESYIRRHQDSHTLHAADSNISDDEFPSMPRSEAVAQVLAEAVGPMAPADIRDILHQAGRNDEYRDVAAALSHLKSRGRAINVARGLWALTGRSFLVEVDEEDGPDSDYQHPEPEDADHEPDHSEDGYWDAVSWDEPKEDDEV